MHRYLPLCLIVGLLVAFRVLGSVLPETQPNFQPLVALFFCGALLAPGWRGYAIPFGIWGITYPLGIGPVSSAPIFLTTLLALGAIFLIGHSLAKRGLPVLLLGAAGSAVVFHLITNGAAWIGSPLYAKSLTGLWQSLWTGPLGATIPSWVFLRNLAAANVLFTALFVLAQYRLPRLAPLAPHAQPAK
ncbi:MAG: DUF6580 family putative transport protein [Akkermansiaceae bacterium]